jgi:NAD(P)-dependent dehydrogenase (short-subunit alcohol dehydrogenase family)
MVEANQVMTGRTCLITGATSGIGRATAIELARRGATLMLVARDRGRGEGTVREIRERTDNREVTLMLADLSSQQSIRELAREFLATNRPLHVLLNNAGVVNLHRTLTVDGIETVFAVNHLGYFLLTNLLLDRLKQSAPARIVNVASEVHKIGALDFDDLQNERRFRSMRVYGQSKLANILFTYELARRLAGTNVTVNCLHPGAVATGLGKNNGAWAQVLVSILGTFFRTPEQGAATSIHLVSSPAVAGVSGKYFMNGAERRSSKASYDDAAAKRLWDISAQMTGIGA